MTEDEIYRAITPIFSDVLDQELVLRPELTARDVETWDSLSNIRLIVAVEQSLGIKFSTAEVGSFQNVGDFVGSISAKLAPPS